MVNNPMGEQRHCGLSPLLSAGYLFLYEGAPFYWWQTHPKQVILPQRERERVGG
jgi:hypothetical protein